MTLQELHDIISRYLVTNKRNCDSDVKIRIKLPMSTVGSLPMVDVKSVQMGFDWEANKFLIYPEEELTLHDADFAEKFRKVESKYGHLYVENFQLKSEVQRLKKLLDDAK